MPAISCRWCSSFRKVDSNGSTWRDLIGNARLENGPGSAPAQPRTLGRCMPCSEGSTGGDQSNSRQDTIRTSEGDCEVEESNQGHDSSLLSTPNGPRLLAYQKEECSTPNGMISKLLAKKFRPLLHALEDDPTQSRRGMIPLRADSASTMLAARIDKLHRGNCCTGVYFGTDLGGNDTSPLSEKTYPRQTVLSSEVDCCMPGPPPGSLH
jgi:hypothetical protein